MVLRPTKKDLAGNHQPALPDEMSAYTRDTVLWKHVILLPRPYTEKAKVPRRWSIVATLRDGGNTKYTRHLRRLCVWLLVMILLCGIHLQHHGRRRRSYLIPSHHRDASHRSEESRGPQRGVACITIAMLVPARPANILSSVASRPEGRGAQRNAAFGSRDRINPTRRPAIYSADRRE